MYVETASRSIAKSVSWRILATFTTILLVWVFTGQIETAITVGGLEAFVKMLVYYLHERGWNKIGFGRKEVKPLVLWFTGLSGSGKGELAEKTENWLLKNGLKVERVNGRSVRKLFPDLGFSKPERVGHIKRVGLLASTLQKNGIFVVASFVSPDKEARDFVRNLCDSYIEIYVSSPIGVAEDQHHQELTQRAKAGEIVNFAGINEPYDPPKEPDLRVDLSQVTTEAALGQVIDLVEKKMKV